MGNTQYTKYTSLVYFVYFVYIHKPCVSDTLNTQQIHTHTNDSGFESNNMQKTGKWLKIPSVHFEWMNWNSKIMTGILNGALSRVLVAPNTQICESVSVYLAVYFVYWVKSRVIVWVCIYCVFCVFCVFESKWLCIWPVCILCIYTKVLCILCICHLGLINTE